METTIRVRFAPAPTGMMHLGNIRTALMNYLFAQKNHGIFALRIEDTDSERNYDPDAHKIMQDLAWLGLTFQEGPGIGGPHAPYFQSQRTEIYQAALQEFIATGKVYRCFCSQEDLETKRQRQIAMKLPPRYDRTCAKLSKSAIQANLAQNMPFIWRVNLEEVGTIAIHDMARGTVTFELKNFSDFPITRQDGSFTFMFSNFVDDMLMKITHVIRGEDHLSNTAGQAALYLAAGKPLPTFWHMPILCNIDGKKLSKRDFGFSLRDLKDAGYLPQAICNYLAIIGGTFEQEVMSLPELAKTFDFDHIKTTGQIKYDVEKLTWLNKQWIMKLDDDQLYAECMPFLITAYPHVKELDKRKVIAMLMAVRTDLDTLKHSVDALAFYFNEPSVTRAMIEQHVKPENIDRIIAAAQEHKNKLATPDAFVDALKATAKEQNIPLKELFTCIRLATTGKERGLGIAQIVDILGADEMMRRVDKI